MQRSEWPPSLLRELWETTVGFRAGPQAQSGARSPLAELARLRAAAGLWHGGRRLARGSNSAACHRRCCTTTRLAARNGGSCGGALPADCRPDSSGRWPSRWSPTCRATHRALAKGRGADSRPGSHEAAELWRLLGSLELLSVADKRELGAMLLDLGPREKIAAVKNAAIWALGRVGARVPLYGPLNTVVPVEAVASWIERVMKLRQETEMSPLALMQLARKTGDRYRDISEKLRREVVAWLKQRQAAPHLVQLVEEGGELEEAEQGMVFGESLPQGLRVL